MAAGRALPVAIMNVLPGMLPMQGTQRSLGDLRRAVQQLLCIHVEDTRAVGS
jgi:hypothetical protein